MLSDKVVFVTGAGAGLGRALVHEFLENGCCVVGTGRNRSSLDETAVIAASDRFLPVVADVADVPQLQAAVQECTNRWGRIDFLFNNAAVYPKLDFLEESPEQFAETLLINVCGIANTCKLILPIMIEQRFGRIMNLGSFADVAPIRNSAAYSAGKGAVHALTKAIAADVGKLGVDVEVHEWIPGHLNTQMSDFTGIDPSISAKWAVQILKGMEPTGRSRIFENEHEWLPPKGLRQRIKDRVLFWKQP